jgi:DNA-binding NarL/FixJ family response regulator
VATPPIRILLADDDPTIRMLLRRLLEDKPSWQICGEASTGSEAVEQAARLAPDLVILDLAMPNMNGIQAAQEISKVFPAMPMLLVSVQEVSKQLAEAAREVGFWGAVTKSSGREVVEGVAALSRNETYFAVENSAVL